MLLNKANSNDASSFASSAKEEETLQGDSQYWAQLTQEDRLNLIQSFSIVYASKNVFITSLKKSLTGEENEEDTDTTYKGVDLFYILDAFNALIGYIQEEIEKNKTKGTKEAPKKKRKDDSSDESNNSNDDNNDDDDSDSDTDSRKKLTKGSLKRSRSIVQLSDEVKGSYHKAKKYLNRIVKIHDRNGVDGNDILELRKHLLKSLSVALGGGFSTAIKKSWLKFTNFIMICLVMSKPKYHMFVPSEYDIKLVKESFVSVAGNVDVAAEIFFDTLYADKKLGHTFRDMFAQSESAQMIHSIGRIVSLSDQLSIFTATLKKLGGSHMNFGVKPKHFKMGEHAFFKMLKSTLGVKWTLELERSWKNVWKYMASVMKHSLKEAYLLNLPPEVQEIKFTLELKTLERIKPKDLSFYSELKFDAWTGNVPSRNFAFNVKNNLLNQHNISEFIPPVWRLELSNSLNFEDLYEKKKMINWAQLKDENCFQREHIKGEFSQLFDLSSFPFDSHYLTININLGGDLSLCKITDKKKQFTIKLQQGSKMSQMGGTDWQVGRPFLHSEKFRNEAKKKTEKIAAVIPVKRSYKYYLYQTFLPLLVIEIVCFQVYFVEHHPIFYRFTTLVPLFFTLLTLKWTVSDTLPPVPYLTMMDIQFNMSYFIFLLHTCATVTIRILDEKDLFVPADNYICLGIVFLVWAVTKGLYIYKCYEAIKNNCVQKGKTYYKHFVAQAKKSAAKAAEHHDVEMSTVEMSQTEASHDVSATSDQSDTEMSESEDQKSRKKKSKAEESEDPDHEIETEF